MKFIYHDNFKSTWQKTPDGHGHWVAEVVCVIVAQSLTEADAKYKELTGKDVTKQPHVGVSFEKNSD